MRFLKKIERFIRDPDYRFIALADLGFYQFMGDEAYLRRRYKVRLGKEPDLIHPQKYTEKLQWLKLYDRREAYTVMVDKYAVKQYVADIIGKAYIVPTLGVWDRFEEIDFSRLPEQFVLKTTHDSGAVVICRDRASFDIKNAKRRMRQSLHRNVYAIGREWPYKQVKPRIIAEEYLEDRGTKELRDYKFFCFDGKVKALFVASDRQKAGAETKFDFFDADYRHLPIRNGHPNAAVMPEKPDKFEEMKAVSEKLSAGLPHVRVDLYEANGRVFFGEFTFYHWSGFTPFDPEAWDDVFGAWLSIADNRQAGSDGRKEMQ